MTDALTALTNEIRKERRLRDFKEKATHQELQREIQELKAREETNTEVFKVLIQALFNAYPQAIQEVQDARGFFNLYDQEKSKNAKQVSMGKAATPAPQEVAPHKEAGIHEEQDKEEGKFIPLATQADMIYFCANKEQQAYVSKHMDFSCREARAAHDIMAYMVGARSEVATTFYWPARRKKNQTDTKPEPYPDKTYPVELANFLCDIMCTR